MNNSRVNIKNVKIVNKELLEPSTPFHSVISNQKLFGSNDANELEIQLRQIRSELSGCIRNLELIDYDYNEVVEKDQFESLKKNYSIEKKKFYFLKKELLLMEQDILQLKILKTQVENDIEKIQKHNKSSKRSLTPRPEWKKCKYIVNNKSFQSSNQLIKVLVEELTATKCDPRNKIETSDSVYEAEKKSNFDNKFILTTHKEILNSVNKVFNRKFNRSELEFILNELISSKIDNDYLLNVSFRSFHKMCHFVLFYFQSKFKSRELALEWVVNIIESCKRFSNLKIAKYMKLVLEDQANEEIFIRFYSSLGSFYYNSIKKSNESNNEHKEIMRIIKHSYAYKSHLFINELINCLKKENFLWDDTKPNFFKLCDFLTCRESVLTRTLNQQFETEKLTNFQKIIDILKKKNDVVVCIEDFLSCVREIQMKLTEREINEHISIIFSDPMIIKLDFSEFEQRLKNCFLIS